METLGSALLGGFINYVKANWSAHSKVDQRRRRLRQLVFQVRVVVDAADGGAWAAVRDRSFSFWLQKLRSEATRGQKVLDDAARAAAVASSARDFLAGLKQLFVKPFVPCAEITQLEEAVEQLELLAGPGGNVDMFFKVLRENAVRAAAMEEDNDMDIDGARHWQEGSGCAGTVAPLFPSPGAKRKRAHGGGEGSGFDSGSTSTSTSRDEFDAMQTQKFRRLSWMRSHQGLPSGFGRVSFAPREPSESVLPRSRRARRIELAKVRSRRGQQQANLGRQFSGITV